MKTTSAFSAFKLVHRALLFGQLLFIGAMFYLLYGKIANPPLAGQDRTLQVIAILFSAIAFFAGNTIFRKKITAIRESSGSTVQGKFEKYRSACILQWALYEGAALFCGICLFLTGNYAFLALAVLLVFFFAVQAPDKNKMAQQLELSTADMETL